jgi:hypothetical protein
MYIKLYFYCFQYSHGVSTLATQQYAFTASVLTVSVAAADVGAAVAVAVVAAA